MSMQLNMNNFNSMNMNMNLNINMNMNVNMMNMNNMNNMNNLKENLNMECKEQQISPSASTFSHGRSFSPAFTNPGSNCDTPLHNINNYLIQAQLQAQGQGQSQQSCFNMSSQPQFLQSTRNQIPKFVPAKTPSAQQTQFNINTQQQAQTQQPQQIQMHLQSPRSVQSIQSNHSPVMQMHQPQQYSFQNAPQSPSQFAFV